MSNRVKACHINSNQVIFRNMVAAVLEVDRLALATGGGGIEQSKLCIIEAKFNCVGGDYDILIYANL